MHEICIMLSWSMTIERPSLMITHYLNKAPKKFILEASNVFHYHVLHDKMYIRTY